MPNHEKMFNVIINSDNNLGFDADTRMGSDAAQMPM